MKKPSFFESMPPIERRSFIKNMSLLLGSAAVPSGVLSDALGLIGETAQAQSAEKDILFLEVNFRDQWDFGHAFVSPSIAQSYANLSKDGDDGLALFSAPEKFGNLYLTAESMPLREHADSVAVLETCELVIGGIHGHEASNATRSPGRSSQGGAGRKDMATVDKRPGGRVGGNEVHYSSSPTPAILHNYMSRQKNPQLANGVILRSSIRSNIHTYYHFEANLANAQMDRFFNRDSFLKFFADQSMPPSGIFGTYREGLMEILKKVDQGFAKDLQLASQESQNHFKAIDLIAGKQATDLRQLQLSPDERSYWTDGIPGQLQCDENVAMNTCSEASGTMNLGEMFGYVDKLFKSGQVKTASIDFDHNDIHTARGEHVLRTQGIQSAVPLSRLISSLKAAGLYDRTLIAMYTLDGSRSPKRNSLGYDSKNGVILAGGMIKGGYYGDIKFDNQTVSYHRPNDQGIAISNGTSGRDQRVPGADIYRTVAKAMGVSNQVMSGIPDGAAGKTLSYLLK
ncbi:hypothetical protein [Pseudobacteriovorax antillogorgiicola]|uniref:Uncharacterized protein n=1 Tax=Pseudobacteriovorax antillogorgiicola TaxID=1513793 RepID=A0A1Y6CED4_9BACT|nr:hypothetical protein [Pseudobacteriovorax antillogorgiicola]TCS48273.1 hypothetical protein EDD56_11853 [Pseudobacteriovorax antillogorgiicola]SMF57072.1 hypothetical protein SAMN06296036_11888 [Pseudobacteriovorax antillogorgiicola]